MGRDWAWAFVGRDGRSNQGMQVQAKRLDDHYRNYGSLYKKSRPTGTSQSILQVERLIERAKHYRLPPVYAFYNHLVDDSRIPHYTCGSLAGLNWRCPESWRVTLASALEVRCGKPDKSFDRHRCHSMPLHCLLCSGGSGQQGAMGSPGASAGRAVRAFAGSADTDDLGPNLTPQF